MKKIAEMKVVDFFEKYVCNEDINTLAVFIIAIMQCNKCPQPCGDTWEICSKTLNKWLDKEVSE